MSAYCRPSSRKFDIDETAIQAEQLAENRRLLVLGEFNSPHTTWGYRFQSKRVKALAKTMEGLELAVLKEPGVIIRRGTGTSRGPIPDLSWFTETLDATWSNEYFGLGLNHDFLSVTISGRNFSANSARRGSLTGTACASGGQKRPNILPCPMGVVEYRTWSGQGNRRQRVLSSRTLSP